MVAASLLFPVLTSSVLVVRAGAVALKLTGMPEQVASFQPRSAFIGTGFTTSESDSVVTYTVRRCTISIIVLYGPNAAVSTPQGN